MAPKFTSTIALFLALNLLLFTFANAGYYSSPPPPPPSPPPPSPPPPAVTTCPLNALQLGVCANVLGLIKLDVGKSFVPCCSLIKNLVDLTAAVCLCTAIEANILGIDIDVAVDISLILNYCGKSSSSGFTCP